MADECQTAYMVCLENKAVMQDYINPRLLLLFENALKNSRERVVVTLKDDHSVPETLKRRRGGSVI